jgi:PE family
MNRPRGFSSNPTLGASAIDAPQANPRDSPHRPQRTCLHVPMLVSPDELVSAAHRLTTIESDIGTANITAAAATTGIAAAARDEVSESLASLFSTYGQQLHAAVEQSGILGTQRFAQGLTAAASSYNGAEQSNVISLVQSQITALENQLNDFLRSPIGFPVLLALLIVELPVLLPIAIGGIALFLAAYFAVVLFEVFVLHSPDVGF